MSNYARKAVFLTLLALFFATGIPLVFFSAGYRLRLETLSITRSGGLYVKSVPQDAEIRINGKPIPNDSGILNSGTFVTGLTPGKYNLEVSKEGYHPFTATAEISPLQADSFEKLTLAPKTYSSYLTGDIDDFYIKGGKAIIKDEADKLRYNGQIIAGEKFEFFTADRKSIVTSSLKNGTQLYFLVSLSNLKALTNINEVFWSLKSSKLDLPGQVPIITMAPHPYDSDKVILSTKAAFYTVDLKSLDITMDGEKAEKIIQENSSIFTVKDDALFGYNATIKTFSPIINIKGNKVLSVSLNGKKVAVLWEDKILEIYDTDDKKSLRFDLSEFPDIKDIFWHKTPGYLFVHSGDNLYFLYVEKENVKPHLIYEGIKGAKYSDGELFVLIDREIKTSRF